MGIAKAASLRIKGSVIFVRRYDNDHYTLPAPVEGYCHHRHFSEEQYAEQVQQNHKYPINLVNQGYEPALALGVDCSLNHAGLVFLARQRHDTSQFLDHVIRPISGDPLFARKARALSVPALPLVLLRQLSSTMASGSEHPSFSG